MKNLRSLILLSLLSATVAFFFASCESEKAPTSDSGESATTESAFKVEHVDAAGAATLLAAADKPTVLDIRTPEEFGAGHIEGATMIDFKAPDFECKVAELDRENSYLVHCRSGGRSTSSLPVFEKLGFKHIIHLDGGFNAWQEGGNAVAK